MHAQLSLLQCQADAARGCLADLCSSRNSGPDVVTMSQLLNPASLLQGLLLTSRASGETTQVTLGAATRACREPGSSHSFASPSCSLHIGHATFSKSQTSIVQTTKVRTMLSVCLQASAVQPFSPVQPFYTSFTTSLNALVSLG